jgi:nucleotide-binding universal stress UspA family protein
VHERAGSGFGQARAVDAQPARRLHEVQETLPRQASCIGDPMARRVNLVRAMKRILVALDSSPRAPLVLERAAKIAAATGAELFLMRAVGLPPELPAEAYRSSPNDLVEMWRQDAVRDLERAARSLDPKIVAHVLVLIGSPWSAICRAARERDVDLLVVGSHGYDAIDHLLGTTAAKVVNHADRSVLVVRPAPTSSSQTARDQSSVA